MADPACWAKLTNGMKAPLDGYHESQFAHTWMAAPSTTKPIPTTQSAPT